MLVCLLLSACHYGQLNQQANAPPKDSILFNSVKTGLVIEPMGIKEYHLATGQLTSWQQGESVQHYANGVTLFLQRCGDSVHQVMMSDMTGKVVSLTSCSDKVTNPTQMREFAFNGYPTRFKSAHLSPDQSHLAVDAFYYDQRYFHRIHIFDINGEHRIYFDGSTPQWLPDGRLLFIHQDQFFIADRSLQHAALINTEIVLDGHIQNPAIHPSGQYFVFEYNREIWRMNINGQQIARVLVSHRPLRFPTWSPDGTMLAFLSGSWGEDIIDQAEKIIVTYHLAQQTFTSYSLEHLLETDMAPWPPISWIKGSSR